jgi:protein-serine/threonine kinase
MKNTMGNHDENGRRPSTDSRRSSFQFLRKNAEAPNESRRNSRRFSFLPNNFSMNSFTGKRDDYGPENGRRESRNDRPTSKGMAFGRGASRSPTRSTASSVPHYFDAEAQKTANRRSGVPQEKALPNLPQQQRKQQREDGYNAGAQQEPVERYYTPNQDLGPPSAASDVQPHFPVSRSPYPTSSHQSQQQQQQLQQSFHNDGYGPGSSVGGQEMEPQTSNMRPNQRKFGDAYEKGHDGSSSGARRVMDFFRRRGRERGGD